MAGSVMMSDGTGFASPPARMPWLMRIMLGIAEKRLGRPLVAHDEAEVPKRLLKLIRIYVSFLASCPFCIDLNAKEYRESGLSDEEILALRGMTSLEEVVSLSEAERAALDYVRCATSTPISFTAEAIGRLRSHLSERAMVVIASTCAQVNSWTRLIQSSGVQPAGFSAERSILELDEYETLHRPGRVPHPHIRRRLNEKAFGKSVRMLDALISYTPAASVLVEDPRRPRGNDTGESANSLTGGTALAARLALRGAGL